MNKPSFILCYLILILPAHALEVSVPRIDGVNEIKKPFIATVSAISSGLFPGQKRSAVAPFGGVKVTPFAELALQELVIVTNSYPGTPAEILKQFHQGKEKLTQVLRQALRSGAMSTSDVLSVTNGAQLLSRLKLELGVNEVEMSYWVEADSLASLKDFSDTPMSPEGKVVATVFEFDLNQQRARLVFISSYIHSDSSLNPGLPSILSAFVPAKGFQWIYISADGLGHFSANRNNGLNKANQQLLGLLQGDGAVLLDYPTDAAYSIPQFFGGISFMEGRLSLEEIGFERIQTIPVKTPGVFGYCLRSGDEVRIYQNQQSQLLPTTNELKQVGPSHQWILK